MYLEFYCLNEKPFSLTPDPAFLYYGKTHRRAVAFLKYGLQESKGFLQLTGPVGSGKTTLLRAVLADLDEKTKTAYIINPRAPFPDLLRSIMKDLEIPSIPQTRLKIELLDFFHNYLLVQARRGNPVILIFDEAQNLSVKNLEEIRMLSNFETTKEKLLQIVFVGQPELVEMLDRPELRQLKQRIQVRYHLSPLAPPEVKKYIGHRLRIAGSDGRIGFSEKACEEIYDFSKGIPRLINSVCDIALLIGFVSEQKTFGADIIKEAIGELNGSFADEPRSGERNEIASEASEESGVDIEPPLPDKNNRLNSSHSIGDFSSVAGSKEKPKLAPNKETTALLDSDDFKTDNRTVPASDKQSAVVTVSDPESSAKNPTQPAEDVGLASKRLKCRDSNVPTDELETICFKSPEPTNHDVAKRRERKAEGELLHSFLRHAKTGRFRVPNTDVAKAFKRDRGVRARLVGLTGKYFCGSNDTTEPSKEAESSRLAGDRAAQSKGNSPCASSQDRYSKGISSSVKAARGRPVARRAYRLPKYAVNAKMEVLFRDGRTALGSTRNISLNETGFYLSPLRAPNGAAQRFVAFEQAIALRFLKSFDERWEKKRSASCCNPKGRQIVVTLLNGEVIEGITPKRFNPECKRFFVTFVGDDGNAKWMLVERMGTAGILTENLKEGIYTEEPKTPEAAVGIPNEGADDPDESSGDYCFSVNDYDSALLKYEKAMRNGADPERLTLKISLSHFKRGIQYMKKNRLREAGSEFDKVMGDARLQEKAREKAKMIREMLKS